MNGPPRPQKDSCVASPPLAFLLAVAVSVGMGSHVPAAWGADELVVSNNNINAVTVYARTASGNTAPLRMLQGAATGLGFPRGIVVDLTHDEMLVANGNGPSVTVYPRNASGNTAPVRTLAGALTGLNNVIGLVVDLVHEELVVVNRTLGMSLNSVTVYPRTANGNIAPLRKLQGAATGLNSADGLALDAVNNELIVANTSNHSVTVYARTASGDTAPLRTLQGPATGLLGPTGVLVDTVNNELLVTNFSNNSVTVYARTASGDTPPLRTLSGAATGLFAPTSVVVDLVNSELVVISELADAVMVYTRTASGNTPPLRTLSGAATGLDTPTFAAVTGPPKATAALNGAVFHSGQTISYQATLTTGPSPQAVDIYLGSLLPDGVTFLSLVQSLAILSVVVGPSPVPFLTDVLLTSTVVPFPHMFNGTEPVGAYFAYAGLAVAGSDPLVATNQLSLSVQPFQFSP